MEYLIKNALIFGKSGFESADILIRDSLIANIGKNISSPSAVMLSADGAAVFPGFSDVHVHFRQPGFCYKETVESGSLAAARGGYTSVCTMPNLSPCPDSVPSLKVQLEAIEKDAKIGVYPFAAITRGQKGEELSDIEELAPFCVGFSDDGRGVQSREMMKEAMLKIKKTGKILSAHCEDNSLLFSGYIHKGEYAERHGHRGICSESEYGAIKRDIELIKETGCPYHVCHISCRESVELIRRAKKDGLDITCETAPHYLVMNDMMLEEDGRFKMNPPIRSEDDRLALIEGIQDGTIDMIATDHAPHSREEKSRGLENSLFGVVGLETAFAVCYTKLVKTGIITMSRLVELLNINAKKRFGIGAELREGAKACLTVFDLDAEYEINKNDFLSKGKASPFLGKEFSANAF